MLIYTLLHRRFLSIVLPILLLTTVWFPAVPSLAASKNVRQALAVTPPMGWNDWAHYECGYTAQDILANAKALVTNGLAARGYDTVTIDDCWMQKDRNSAGDLQADPHRFPQGIKPVADAVHALGLKFGIYEDAGSLTCGGFAGSGEPKGGGKNHFVQDAKLFESWGVDYLKLDGCNVYVPKGENSAAVYRKAYAAENAALKTVNRPIIFSESAPAYFQGTPDWYDVLTWVRDYGQLWREGTDIVVFNPKKPDAPRFDSVLWNYAYNLPLGRFQKPGNWNDSDFIIGGDAGLSLAETRSQLSLWSMMSAPLILSSNVQKLSAQAVAILGNKAVIAVDKDGLGRMATLVRRTSSMDVLFKALSAGNYAVAVLNRGTAPVRIELRPEDFGFGSKSGCRLDAQNLWSGVHQPRAATLQADIASHDTAIWKIRPGSSCGTPRRTGTITLTAAGKHHDVESYSRCLSASKTVGTCEDTLAERWTISTGGTLKSAAGCLSVVDGTPVMQKCSASKAQHWRYTLVGNLINASKNECLSASGPDSKLQSLSMQTCGHNQPNQVWSLPN